VVNIEDISQVYDARNHPDVKAGKRSVADILNEFLETFETHHNLSDLSRRDRNVTLEEFEEYYENVSASIDNDLYFEVMMKNAWKIPEPGKQQAPWHASIPFAGKSRQVQRSSGPPFAVSETPTCFSTSSKDKLLTPVESILDEFKAKLKARGARGFIGLARQFKVMDDDRSGKINFTEFLKALKDFRVDLSPEDASKLFRLLDADRSGEIDYEELVHRVRGELNEMRRQLVSNVFQSLDKDGNGVVNVEDINGVFTADKHPDVRNGRKSQEQVLREFLEGFEMHHALFRENTQDGNVTLEEFLEYYKHLSASIDDDRYFEMMIRNAWKLNGKENGKAWSCNFGRKGF
jgi:Ca2+-binding EF-hand superfamily protein